MPVPTTTNRLWQNDSYRIIPTREEERVNGQTHQEEEKRQERRAMRCNVGEWHPRGREDDNIDKSAMIESIIDDLRRGKIGRCDTACKPAV